MLFLEELNESDMKIILFRLTIYLLFAFHVVGYAQNPTEKPFMRFRNISGNLGLPGEFARCITQDHKGLMWFGTDVSIKYFDGYSFTEYPIQEDDIIVTAITTDHLGNIWATASADAIYELDRKRNIFNRYQVTKDTLQYLGQVYPLLKYGFCLFEDSQQMLWVSTYEGI